MLSHGNRHCFAFTPEHLQGLLVHIRGCSNPPPLKSSQAAVEYTLWVPAQTWLSTTRSCAPKPGKQASAALSQVEKGKPCWTNRIPRHRRFVEWAAPPEDAIYSLVQLGRGVVPRQMSMLGSAQHVRKPGIFGSPCARTTWPAMQQRFCHGSIIDFRNTACASASSCSKL